MFVAIPHLWHRYQWLQRTQWATPKVLRRIQLRRLQRLVRWAYDHVPYYRALFDEAGFAPDDLRSLDDMRRVPISDKSSMTRSGQESLTADTVKPDRLIPLSTTGSTGLPLSFCVSRREKFLRVVTEWRALGAHGVQLTDKVLQFRNTRHVYKGNFWFQRFGLMRRVFAHFGEPTERKIEIIETQRPTLLQGYPSVLLDIVRHAGEQRVRRWPVRYVVSCGEVLDMNARRLLEEAFQLPVINHYGAMEFGYLAWQCPEFEGLHLNEEVFYFEVLRDGEPVDEGEEGEIVVTSLDQYAMPFIRYRLGDRCRLLGRHCPCGRVLATIDVYVGRTIDRVIRRDGTEVNPHLLGVLYKEVPGLFQYQIIQRSTDRFLVRFVLLADARPQILKQRFEQRISEIMGYPVTVEFEQVDHFPPDETGKLKFIRSEIGEPITDIAPSIRDQVFLDSIKVPS